MSTSIYTLIPDIQSLLTTKGWMSEALAKEFGDAVANKIRTQFEAEKAPSLRLSGMGPRCPRALWYSIHSPGEAEPLPPWSEIKFSLGHFQEVYGLILAKAAGHRVEREQHEVTLSGVKGHIDCLIDGVLVDFKSCSRRQFDKYKSGSIAKDDPFGSLDQLDGYATALREDPCLLDKEHAYIFAFQKELGHACIYEHTCRPESIKARIVQYKCVVGMDEPPACECGTVDIGASGNVGLDTRASYSPFKWSCRPNLRCFLYATGPVYLTRVMRKPDVPEVDRYGKPCF